MCYPAKALIGAAPVNDPIQIFLKPGVWIGNLKSRENHTLDDF
jgi:hypothetical protein